MAENSVQKILKTLNVQATQSDPKEKTIEVDEFTIKGHLLRWKDVVIQISNISLVTAVDVVPPEEVSPGTALRQLCGALIALAGMLSLLMGLLGAAIGAMRGDDAGTFLGLGVILSIAGIAMIAYRGQVSTPPTKRYLDIYLNSGNRYSLLFEDNAFRRKVLNFFSMIFQDGATEIKVPTTIEIKDPATKNKVLKPINITIDIKNSEFKGDASVIKELNSIIQELNMV